jgi:hypothetical protein
MIKKMIRLPALTVFLAITAACGGNAPPTVEIEIDAGVALFSEVITPDATDASSENIAARQTSTPVSWGTRFLNTDIEPDSFILEYFRETHGVDLELLRVPFDLGGGDRVPDIFYGEAANLYERGFTRTIPRAMIEIHAPDYAALLSSIPYGWEMGKVSGTDEYIGIFAYDISQSFLTDFSAYRLDWLEALDIPPPGELIEIALGVYFSPTSYNHAEFMHIMRQFSLHEMSDIDAFTRGFGLYLSHANMLEINSIHDPVASLMGMWGLNLYNMSENGKAIPYYISEAYKEFLHFLRESGHYNDDIILYMGNVLYPRGFPASIPSQYEAGWSSLHTGVLNEIIEAHLNVPTRRYLITPPETGPNGIRGGGAKYSGSLFDQSNQWVINQSVSDHTLTQALKTYNALAFNPDAYILAMFGREGTDFTWAGEPLHSLVVPANNPRTRSRNGVGMFDPLTLDGRAGNPVYFTGRNAVFDFAASEAGRQMVLWPYKDDITGKNAGAFNAINRSIILELNNFAREFYYFVLFSDDGNVEEYWDYYLAELNERGLQEYLDLLEDYEFVMH